jgi:hypothetical protein
MEVGVERSDDVKDPGERAIQAGISCGDSSGTKTLPLDGLLPARRKEECFEPRSFDDLPVLLLPFFWAEGLDFEITFIAP